jgi:hypothetical protein
MTIFPFADSRLITTNLTSFPLNAVATVDSQFQRPVAVNPNLPINWQVCSADSDFDCVGLGTLQFD